MTNFRGPQKKFVISRVRYIEGMAKAIAKEIGISELVRYIKDTLYREQGRNWAMRGPPKIIFRGIFLKYFFLDGDAKERAPKGRCQARGVWGHAPPENFAEFDLILEAFCAF